MLNDVKNFEMAEHVDGVVVELPVFQPACRKCWWLGERHDDATDAACELRDHVC